jgi:hypothetical protein
MRVTLSRPMLDYIVSICPYFKAGIKDPDLSLHASSKEGLKPTNL